MLLFVSSPTFIVVICYAAIVEKLLKWLDMPFRATVVIIGSGCLPGKPRHLVRRSSICSLVDVSVLSIT